MSVGHLSPASPQPPQDQIEGPAPSSATPVDTVDALQVSHGLANLQRVQDESEHLHRVLVPLQVVSQLQEGGRCHQTWQGLSMSQEPSTGRGWCAGKGKPRQAKQGGPAISSTNSLWVASAEYRR